MTRELSGGFFDVDGRGVFGVDLMRVSRDLRTGSVVRMVVGAAGVETVNRVAIGGLMVVARCAVGKTKLVEVDLCRIRRDGHDTLRIAEIAKD